MCMADRMRWEGGKGRWDVLLMTYVAESFAEI